MAATMAVTLRSFLLPIARHFQHMGWEVDAIANGAAYDGACLSTFDHVWEAPWSRNPLHISNFTSAAWLRKLARTRGYDIVHVHTPVAGFVTRMALRELRQQESLQLVYTAHGFHFHPQGGSARNRAFAFLEQRAANWTDFLVVINRPDFAAAQEMSLLEPGRVRLMPGIGVDRTDYNGDLITEADLAQLQKELGAKAGEPILLMIAEFTPRKRHADALRAFAVAGHPAARMLFAGTGPLEPEMKILAQRLGVASRVHFLGQRSDVPLLLKASRALVLPSSQEGLPRCVLEAMSMGVPAIGTRVRGTGELLERGAGLLTRSGDVQDLANAMQIVLNSPDAASAMGRLGKQQSEAYDLAHILRMHEALYQDALAARRSAGTRETIVPSPAQASSIVL